MKKTLVLTALTLFVGNIGTSSAHASSSAERVEVRTDIQKRNMMVSLHKIDWYKGKGQWTLYPKFDRCKDVAQKYDKRHETVCYKARMALERHTARYRRLHDLLFPPPKPRSTWLDSAFACIQRYEGAWDDDTGNGYYGGLQMDITFQQQYGKEYYDSLGTADKWPKAVQIKVAERAYRSGRGFYPWPNTARACGYL